MVVQSSAESGASGTKRVEVWLHWNLRQKLCRMFILKRQNKQWGYFKTKISSVRAFRCCVAHANSMCARRDITIQNLCHTWVILMTTHFFYPNIGVSALIFWKFSSQVKIRYLRQPPVKFLQQLKDYSENDLVLKIVDDLLAIRYASLTTKSSYFVWSMTSWNLNQFQKNLVFWNQHEKLYLLINFEENLRWWVDLSNFFGSFDMEWHGKSDLDN